MDLEEDTVDLEATRETLAITGGNERQAPDLEEMLPPKEGKERVLIPSRQSTLKKSKGQGKPTSSVKSKDQLKVPLLEGVTRKRRLVSGVLWT